MRVKESKIKHLMSQYHFRPKGEIPLSDRREYNLNKLLGKKVKEYPTFIGVNPSSQQHKDRMLVFEYYYKLGKTDSEICDIWLATEREKRVRQSDRDLMPKSGRDNGNPVTNTRNYNGGSGNWSSIRVPSKKHKNRFKNFKKLFKEYYEKMGL